MEPPIRRRHVFFCHGFDRRGPRFFNLWQRKEAARYNKRFRTSILVGDRNGARWNLSTDDCTCTFTVCDWTPIVKRRFATSAPKSTFQTARIAFAGLRQGFFRKVIRVDWSMGLLLLWGFLPVFLTALAGILALLIAPLWILPVLAIWIAMDALAKRFDHYLGLSYIAHIAWAARRMALQDHAEIEACVARAITDVNNAPDADEVIIIGHSIGAALALRIAAGATRPVRLLTVGQSIPLVTFQREAKATRDAMATLEEGSWTDVSARKDMLGFLAFDPSEGHANCITVNLKRAFGAARVAALRWHGFNMHFLCFHANEQTAPWDWFRILTSPQSLTKQFEGAKPRTGRGERRLLF